LVHQGVRPADLGPLVDQPDAVEFEGLVAMAKCRPTISDNGLGNLALRVGFVQVNYAIPLLLLALLLILGTSLPWFVGQIMPDIFTPLMILALSLLCFAKYMSPRPSYIILVLLIGTAVAFHQANLLVALWMLPALGLCALLGWRPSKPFLRGLFASGIGLTLGVIALVTMNLVSDRFGLSSGSSVFLLARFIEDGTALNYLEKACPQRRFSVCAYLDEFRSYPTMRTSPGCRSSFQPSLSNHFLWDGPLERLGGFRAEQSEASAVVAGTLSAYPLAQSRLC